MPVAASSNVVAFQCPKQAVYHNQKACLKAPLRAGLSFQASICGCIVWYMNPADSGSIPSANVDSLIGSKCCSYDLGQQLKRVQLTQQFLAMNTTIEPRIYLGSQMSNIGR